MRVVSPRRDRTVRRVTQGLESAKAEAEIAQRDADAEAADRADIERYVSEFVHAVDQCLRLMHEHGNPGLERITAYDTVTGGPRVRSAWTLESPRAYPTRVNRALTPSGDFASLRG